MASIQEARLQKVDQTLCQRRLHEWARTLGVPGDPVVVSFGKGDFRVEAVGAPVSRVEYAPGRVFITDNGTTMLARGVRIKREGCLAYIEALFDPDGGFTIALQDIQLLDRKANDRALAGLKVLRALSRGRPTDDRQERCSQFLAGLPSAICRARDAREERGDPRHGDLTLYELAAEFGWHEDTLSARCAECGVDWSKTKRRPGSRVAVADSH
jgi:hypothetical protein